MSTAEGLTVVLVTDKIYPKTGRFLQKILDQGVRKEDLILAIVAGYEPRGERPGEFPDFPAILKGTIPRLAEMISRRASDSLRVLALNQSAVLPGLALRCALGLPWRSGLIEACDKLLMRQLLAI